VGAKAACEMVKRESLMVRAELSIGGASRWMRYSARAWTLVWASWCAFMLIVVLLDPRAGVIAIRRWIIAGPLELALMLFSLGGAAVPWLRERAGGAVRVLRGVLALVWAGSPTSAWPPMVPSERQRERQAHAYLNVF